MYFQRIRLLNVNLCVYMYSFTYWSRTALRKTNKQNKNKIKQVIKTCCQYEKTALGSSVLLNFKIVFFNHWLIWAQSSRGLHCVAVWGSYPSITSLQNTWQVAQSKFWHVQGECNWTLVHRNIWVCKFFKKQKKILYAAIMSREYKHVDGLAVLVQWASYL